MASSVMENIRLSLFFNFVFWSVMVIQLLFTFKYLLSFTGNEPLILFYELIFCFEAVLKNSYLICSLFSSYSTSALVTNLKVKQIYIVFRVSLITNSFKQIQHDK